MVQPTMASSRTPATDPPATSMGVATSASPSCDGSTAGSFASTTSSEDGGGNCVSSTTTASDSGWLFSPVLALASPDVFCTKPLAELLAAMVASSPIATETSRATPSSSVIVTWKLSELMSPKDGAGYLTMYSSVPATVFLYISMSDNNHWSTLMLSILEGGSPASVIRFTIADLMPVIFSVSSVTSSKPDVSISSLVGYLIVSSTGSPAAAKIEASSLATSTEAEMSSASLGMPVRFSNRSAILVSVSEILTSGLIWNFTKADFAALVQK
mmetsp:Transcript_53526/g.81202  ORF Transcript_53526/g.81202 Transcript_53526/m.81202 type:complete len:271 (+) Transcript_53526:477-1289(+)